MLKLGIIVEKFFNILFYLLVFFFVGEYVRVEGVSFKGVKSVLYKYDIVNVIN